jgi:ectoine hydroxylase-related dioxygenase (phytanoyl-CoA dioxygenase family)
VDLSSPVNEATIQRFRADGFVVVPSLLDADECDRFGRAVDATVADRTRGDPRPLAERTRYEQSFRQCLNLWEDSEAVRRLSFHPLIARTAAALLGAGAIRVWHDQALYKEAGGRITAGHYDEAYWPIAGGRTITAWIPFDGSTLAAGAMGYVPGSHLDGRRRFPNIFTEDGFDLEAGPEAGGRPTQWVEVPAGGVAFHHGRTLHTARPNTTGSTRRVHTVIYFADGSRRSAKPPSHPSVDRVGIEVGEPITSVLTPLAWPRDAGDWPDTPPLPEPLLPGWPGWSWAAGLERFSEERS